MMMVNLGDPEAMMMMMMAMMMVNLGDPEATLLTPIDPEATLNEHYSDPNPNPTPEGRGKNVEVGDYAILYGEGGPPLKEVATLLSTAQSDITCVLGRSLST